MKTLVLYYTWSGKCEQYAKQLADAENAHIVNVADIKRPNTIAAYVIGSLRARRFKPSSIQPLDLDMSIYEKIIIVAPVWAGFPSPPVNAVINQLPAGAKVEMILVSGSGKNEPITTLARPFIEHGCELVDVKSVRASDVS